MKNTVSKERIAEVFDMFPTAKSVYVTSDGTIFTDKNASFARDHAKSSNLKVEQISREEFESSASGTTSTTAPANDWKKNLKSIDEYASKIEGFEFPATANTKAEKIAAIEAYLAKPTEVGAEGGAEGSEEGTSDVPGANATTNHSAQ